MRTSKHEQSQLFKVYFSVKSPVYGIFLDGNKLRTLLQKGIATIFCEIDLSIPPNSEE
jgi:hypothetical protein